MSKYNCTTKDCTNDAYYLNGKCKTCYSYFARWLKMRSVSRIRARQAQIEVWQNRLSEMLKPRVVKAKRRAR